MDRVAQVLTRARRHAAASAHTAEDFAHRVRSEDLAAEGAAPEAEEADISVAHLPCPASQ